MSTPLSALVGSALLTASQPTVPLMASGAAFLVASKAQAQTAESVAKTAREITVRIEGATQGSGIVVKKEQDTYTILTSWHVVSSQRPGEEIGIVMFDGKSHKANSGSIQQILPVDMATLTFKSPVAYNVATPGSTKTVVVGSRIYVSGYPLPTSSVPARIFRFREGRIEANTDIAIPDGYQLLYSNPTLPGMSGGGLLDENGFLVGIHGRGETDIRISRERGIAVKTGTNQAVPIGYFQNSIQPNTFRVKPLDQTTTAGDYLAKAVSILSRGVINTKDNMDIFDQLDDLASKSISLAPNSSLAWSIRARALAGKGQSLRAIRFANNALSLNPAEWSAYLALANAKSAQGDYLAAIKYLDKLMDVNEKYAYAYLNRGVARSKTGDYHGSIEDFSKALELNPLESLSYINRGISKYILGDKNGAIADYSSAIAINPQDALVYARRGDLYEDLGDIGSACSDWRKAASFDNVMVKERVQNQLDQCQ